MSGKISVGVRRTTTGVRIRISSAITTKVYGLRRANATIHIEYCPQLPWGKPAAANSAARYKWPHPFTLKMESCGRPGTDYDDEARVVTICYETPFDFAELYRAYVFDAPVQASTDVKRKRTKK